MITATIDRIEKINDTEVSVCVGFIVNKVPTQKFYNFKLDGEITLDTIKERVKVDIALLESIESKLTILQTLVGQKL